MDRKNPKTFRDSRSYDFLSIMCHFCKPLRSINDYHNKQIIIFKNKILYIGNKKPDNVTTAFMNYDVAICPEEFKSHYIDSTPS